MSRPLARFGVGEPLPYPQGEVRQRDLRGQLAGHPQPVQGIDWHAPLGEVRGQLAEPVVSDCFVTNLLGKRCHQFTQFRVHDFLSPSGPLWISNDPMKSFSEWSRSASVSSWLGESSAAQYANTPK